MHRLSVRGIVLFALLAVIGYDIVNLWPEDPAKTKQSSFGYHVTLLLGPNAVYLTGFPHVGTFIDEKSEAPEPSEDDPGEKH